MPVKSNREYRQIALPLTISAAEKRIESDCYVEGYATTFDQPYLLYEYSDGTKFYERIDRNALDGADLSDVIFQYNHSGRVYARKSNGTLGIEANEKGLFVFADLSKTDAARGMYQDIASGMATKMSWGFTVIEESYDRATHTRSILKVGKVYDVSAVDFPANDSTEISARSFAQGRLDAEAQELRRVDEYKRRIKLLLEVSK